MIKKFIKKCVQESLDEEFQQLCNQMIDLKMQVKELDRKVKQPEKKKKKPNARKI